MFNSPKKQLEELEQYRRKTNALNFVEGVLVGGLIGLGVGLLLAPRSGNETMVLIEEKTKGAIDKSKGKLSFKGCCKKSAELIETDDIESEVIVADDFYMEESDLEEINTDEEMEKLHQKY